jgi:hypothetical protein
MLYIYQKGKRSILHMGRVLSRWYINRPGDHHHYQCEIDPLIQSGYITVKWIQVFMFWYYPSISLIVKDKTVGLHMFIVHISIICSSYWTSQVTFPGIGTRSLAVSPPWREWSTFYAADAINTVSIFHSTRYPSELVDQKWYGFKACLESKPRP